MQLHILLPQINFGETFKKLSDYDLDMQRRDAATLFEMLATCGLIWSSGRRFGEVGQVGEIHAWHGYEYGLSVYAMRAGAEWRTRGHQDDLTPIIASLLARSGVAHDYKMPPWVGDLTVHRAHRAYLIRQNPAYARVWPGTDASLPMVSPILSPNHIDGYYLETIGE